MITIDKLNQYGANTKEGLARCVNNESLYLRLVGMVPNNQGFNALYDSIENNDLDSAFSACHGLKGILANLSLTPLSQIVEELTELLRKREKIDYSQYIKNLEDKRKLLEDLINL